MEDLLLFELSMKRELRRSCSLFLWFRQAMQSSSSSVTRMILHSEHFGVHLKQYFCCFKYTLTPHLAQTGSSFALIEDDESWHMTQYPIFLFISR